MNKVQGNMQIARQAIMNRRRRRHDDMAHHERAHHSSSVPPRRVSVDVDGSVNIDRGSKTMVDKTGISSNNNTIRAMRSSMPPNLNGMSHARVHVDDQGVSNNTTDSSEEKNLPTNNPLVNLGTASASTPLIFKKGMEAFYQTSSTIPCAYVPARILDVHYDDMLVPYYTILRKDNGVEKQTDGCRLTLTRPVQESPSSQSRSQEDEDEEVAKMEDELNAMTFDETQKREKSGSLGICQTCSEPIQIQQGLEPELRRPRSLSTGGGLHRQSKCVRCSSLGAAQTPQNGLSRRKASTRPRHHSLQPNNRTGRLASQSHAKPLISKNYGRRATVDSSQEPSTLNKKISKNYGRRATIDSVQEPNDSLDPLQKNITSLDSVAKHRPQSYSIQAQTETTIEPKPAVEPSGNDVGRRLNKSGARRRGQRGKLSSSMPPMRAPIKCMEVSFGNPPGRKSMLEPRKRQEDTLHKHPQSSNEVALVVKDFDDSKIPEAIKGETTVEPKSAVAPSRNDVGRRLNRNRARQGRQRGKLSSSMPPIRAPNKSIELSFDSPPGRKSMLEPRRTHEGTLHEHPQSANSEVALVVKDCDDSKIPETVLKRRHTRDTDPDSYLYSSMESNDNMKQLVDDLGSTRKVDNFRCHDSNGDFGFYSGTVNAVNEKDDLPHGKGEMIYDSGHIAKGVWVQGFLKMNVRSDQERYKPDVLLGYSVGEIGRYDDMEVATTRTVSKLHVGDCAFIRRSNGKWSYSIVKSRLDVPNEESITFLASRKGCTKTISIHKWQNHVRLPKKASVLPGYVVGDPGSKKDMIASTEEETVSFCQQLRIDDAAFVRRTGGSWTYSIVIDRTEGDDATITFEIDPRGSTKSIQVSHSWRRICQLRQRSVSDLFEGKAEVVTPQLDSNVDSPALKGEPSEDELDQSREQDAPHDIHPAQASSFFFEGPQVLQQVYKGLDQRHEEGSVSSDTVESQNQGPSYLGNKYVTHSNQGADDNLFVTDTMGPSFTDGYSSLSDESDGDIKQRLLTRIIERQQRSDGDGADDSIEYTLPGNVVPSGKKGNPVGGWEEHDAGGYSSLADASKGSARDRKKDRLLMHLIAKAAMEDTMDGEDSIDISLDESLQALRDSFLAWRQAKSEDNDMVKSIDIKKESKERENISRDKKKKSKERKKRSGNGKEGRKQKEDKPQVQLEKRVSERQIC